jgi:hypothetical protein
MQPDLTSVCKLDSNLSLNISSATFNRGLITVEADYSGKINGKPASFTVSINSSTFISSTYTVSFDIKADGLSFYFVKNAQTIKTLKKAFNAIDLIVGIIFLSSLFLHKMLGV